MIRAKVFFYPPFSFDIFKASTKINMMITKAMFNTQLAGQQSMIGNEALERVEEYTHPMQTLQIFPTTRKSKG